MAYIGNTPRNPVFIEDFSDECPVAVWTILQAWPPISRLHTLVQTYQYNTQQYKYQEYTVAAISASLGSQDVAQSYHDPQNPVPKLP